MKNCLKDLQGNKKTHATVTALFDLLWHTLIQHMYQGKLADDMSQSPGFVF